MEGTILFHMRTCVFINITKYLIKLTSTSNNFNPSAIANSAARWQFCCNSKKLWGGACLSADDFISSLFMLEVASGGTLYIDVGDDVILLSQILSFWFVQKVLASATFGLVVKALIVVGNEERRSAVDLFSPFIFLCGS